eukprot:jgi/Botrbrau1/13959/Bobra.250_1s0013.1
MPTRPKQTSISLQTNLQLRIRPNYVKDNCGNIIREYTTFSNGTLLQHLQADKAEDNQTVLLHAIGQQYPCTAVGFSELLTSQPHLKLDEAGEQLLDCIKLIIRELDSSLEDDLLETSQICVAGSVAMLVDFIDVPAFKRSVQRYLHPKDNSRL